MKQFKSFYKLLLSHYADFGSLRELPLSTEYPRKVAGCYNKLMDDQTLKQLQTNQNNDFLPAKNDNLSEENHEVKLEKYKNLKHAKHLIIIAFIIFIITFVVVGFSFITDLNCRCEYAVCYCGLSTIIFGVFAIIPAIISTILASKGMSTLKRLENEGVPILQQYRILGTISLFQILIFAVMIGVAFIKLG